MNMIISEHFVELVLLLAACSLAFLQVASLPVWDEDKLPTIDLRETGCIHQIEDEGTCGASYAYTAIALNAYYDCMSKKPAADAKGSVERYHARFVTDCGTYFSEHIAGCRGGFVSDSVDFIRENGLPLYGDYESAQAKAGNTDKCPVPIPVKDSGVQNWQINLQPMKFLQQAKLVRIKFEQIHDHLSKHGPVVANIQLWPEYESFTGGYFESFADNEIFEFRSMLIVGFGYNEDSRAYYTLWNSLGEQWGNSGYLKILEHSLRMHNVNFYGLVSGAAE